MAEEHIRSLQLIEEGDWDAAHQLIQGFDDQLACMIHGYLHLVEGDENNAAYWYSHAGMTLPIDTIEQEFERLSNLANQSDLFTNPFD